MRVIVAAAGLVTVAAGAALATLPMTRAPIQASAATPRAAPTRVADGRVWFANAATPLAMPKGTARPIRSLISVTVPMQFGDYRWSESGVPTEGPIWIRIDLGRQLLSVFRGADEIGTAVILYGTDGKPTPTGTFHVMARAAAYQSRTYDASMPYMLRLTDDGVAIHASAVRRGFATHGCIGVPEAFARRLFAVTRRGDLVAIMPAA